MNERIINLSQRTVSNGSFTLSRSFNPFMLCTYTVNITVQYSTVQYSTVQYSTVQYSTVQYSTVQYSTVQLRGRMTGGRNK